MRRFLLILAALPALAASPAAAGTVTYVEEWTEPASARFVSPAIARAERQAIAAFGPFRVLDGGTAALVAATDERTPAQFQAMLAAYPDIATLQFVDCPGTHHDRANLRLGRMIRAAGLATEVTQGGSVRSGAVELFLAGTIRPIADGAEFAVHAWLDDTGHEASDYDPADPEHRKYLAYYREMGMSAAEAESFYAMTNSVPFDDARWLSGAEMRRWLGQQPVGAPEAEPRLAYLDLGAALN